MATPFLEQSKQARLKILEMVFKAQSSHIGSNFSVVDIFTVLFDKKTEDDQIILSAGWKAASFYYFLTKEGLFSESELDTYNQEGSKLIGLTEPGVPGVLFAGGSMQMGAPASVGFAMAKKLKGEQGKVFCVLSDGELGGGMIWESAMIANHHKLDNLVFIVDNNRLQAMGKTNEILSQADTASKFRSFGFAVLEINGHDFSQLESSFDWLSEYQVCPVVIIADTIKGKGVSFMEENNLYHYKNLSEEEYFNALAELDPTNTRTFKNPYFKKIK